MRKSSIPKPTSKQSKIEEATDKISKLEAEIEARGYAPKEPSPPKRSRSRSLKPRGKVPSDSSVDPINRSNQSIIVEDSVDSEDRNIRTGGNNDTHEIDSFDFYDEYHGHRLDHLENVLAGMRRSTSGKQRSAIFLAGDSSLDNKFWFPDSSTKAVNGMQHILK